MRVDIYNKEGKITGRSIELPEEIFGIEPNEHVMYLAVKQFNANQRQGTHKSKERNEISGSTRKLKKQKGTGTARAGSIKNPLFKGGGRVFGPRPRDYEFKLNKKVKKLAKASALSQKLASGQLKVIENFTFDSPKTKSMTSILSGFGVDKSKSLVVVGAYDQNVYLSGRNIPNSGVMTAADLNTFSILRTKELILTEASIETLKASF